jgi:type IV secretory pathway VirB10-like protein
MTDETEAVPYTPPAGVPYMRVAGYCTGAYLLGVCVGAWVATKNSPCAQHADDAATVNKVARASAKVRETLGNAVKQTPDAPPAATAPEAPAAPPAAPADLPKPAAGPTAPPVEEVVEMAVPVPGMSLPHRTLPSPRVPMQMEPVRAPVVVDEVSEALDAPPPARPRGRPATKPSTNGSRPTRGPKGAAGAA